MHLDPRTAVATMSVLGLVFALLATTVRWSGRTYPGYVRWMCAGLLTVFSLFLLNLRPNAPDWVSIVAANAVLILASILHFEGALEFRGLPPRRWPVYVGGSVTIGALTFFLYVVPNLNARAAVMSTFLGVIFVLGCITISRAIPATHRLGLRLTGTLFGLCAATHLFRAAYCAFGPPLGDLFALSGVNGALFLALSVQISLFPIGFILLADERTIADLKDAKERALSLKESLRESEERLRLAMSSGTIGVWDWDASSGQLTVSPEFGRIYGLDVTKLRSYGDFAACVHPDDLARVESERRAAIHNHQPFDAEFRILRSSGEIRWIATRGQAYYDQNDRVVRVVGNSMDITERIHAKEGLQERERRLRLALDASRGGSWTWDARTGRVDWDDRFRKLYGFIAEEPASADTWQSRIHEEDRPRVLGVLDEILRTPARNDWENSFRIVRPDGTVAWIESRGRADRDVEGRVVGLTGLDLDITERRRAEEVLQAHREEERDRALHKQAEEALRRNHAELEQRTLQLSRLASQLTLAEQSVRKQLASTLHDGLQQLLFSAGITLDQAVKPNSKDDPVELLRRARALVKEAVEAARTLSLNLFPPVLHVGGLPAALTWLARRTQEQYSIVVNVTADPQANPEASDVRILLFEGVRELLFNVVKHARVDRVDVNLALGPGDTIHIQVSDDGAGFDPSATLHDGNHPQEGLGLFSIQERFALRGGHLDIVSAPGKGSRFTLTLPRTGLTRLATDGTETPRRDTDRPDRPFYNFARRTSQSLRILIADDHAVVRAGLRELFSNRPLLQVVGEAANGVEAISHAKALQPDVILMDVAMPQKNGIEATREIHGALPHIQIVGLSTYGDETTERAMREAGAQAYFSKTESTHRLFDYLLSLHPQAKGTSGT